MYIYVSMYTHVYIDIYSYIEFIYIYIYAKGPYFRRPLLQKRPSLLQKRPRNLPKRPRNLGGFRAYLSLPPHAHIFGCVCHSLYPVA